MMKALSSSCASSHQGAATASSDPMFFNVFISLLIVHSREVEFKDISGNFEAPLVLLTGLRNASDVGMVAAAELPCSSIQQSHRGVVLLLLCFSFFCVFCFVKY